MEIVIGGILYFILLVTLGIISLRKGHWVMFIIGIFIPLFWIIGALMPAEQPRLAGRPRTRSAARQAARWRSMMRVKSVPAGQRAEGLAPVAVEAGGAEGVGDRLVAEADHQRALQQQRHPLDDAAGARLDLGHVRRARRAAPSASASTRGSDAPSATSAK